MNIAVGKICKSLQFHKEYRNTGHGDLCPMASIITLCRKHPNDKFYLIGRSDLFKSAKTEDLRKYNEIPDNLIDLEMEARNRYKAKKDKTPVTGFNFTKKTYVDRENVCEYLVDLIKEKNIKFDYGIIYYGPDCGMGTPYTYSATTWKKDKTKKLNKLLSMAINSASPIVHTINTFKIPHICVCEDPRYVPFNMKDMIYGETCTLSHLNGEYTTKRLKGYFDDSLEELDFTQRYIYSGIERISLLFLKKYDFRNRDGFEIDGKKYKKNGFFFVACNESPSRFKNIKNWVLDNFNNVPIYGKWSDETIGEYKSRFIDKPMAFLQDEMWRAKYTYVPGFFDKMTNFVTIKIWEMCIYGILPFFDKTKYDSDQCCPVPDYLRCSTPQEMKEKIEYLEANPEEYFNLLDRLYDIVSEDYFNGDFIDKVYAPIFNSNDPSKLTYEDWKEWEDNLIASYKKL